MPCRSARETRKVPAREPERLEHRLERARIHAEIQRSGEEHVARDAANRLEVEQLAHLPLAARAMSAA